MHDFESDRNYLSIHASWEIIREHLRSSITLTAIHIIRGESVKYT